MTAQTTTQRTAAHRRRGKERLARYEAALQEIARLHITGHAGGIAREALNPTDPAKTPE